MKYRKISVHILGLFLFIIFLSISRNLLIITVAGAAFLSVSISQHLQKTILSLPGLSLVSLLLPYTGEMVEMGEPYLLLFYTLVTALPLLLYWSAVLVDTVNLDIMAIAISTSYFTIVLVAFYALVIFAGLQDYLFASANKGPQALLLSGCAVLLFLAYNIRNPKL